jgi:hypothetical protein
MGDPSPSDGGISNSGPVSPARSRSGSAWPARRCGRGPELADPYVGLEFLQGEGFHHQPAGALASVGMDEAEAFQPVVRFPEEGEAALPGRDPGP